MVDAPVIIAGGGPVGLTLALELDHQGVDCILLERNLTTTRHPKMDITNGRSMELFRRLGVSDLLRDQAVPPHHHYSVVWCTNLVGWELARFDYPSVDQKRDELRSVNDGTSALEPGMRVSQILLEPVLKKTLERDRRHVSVRFGWALEGFDQDADGVDVRIRSTETGEAQTLRTNYLAGCDGAGSVARRQLNIPLHDIEQPHIEADGLSAPPRRRLYMIHFRSPERERIERFGRAWHLQSPEGWSMIAQDDVDTWTIHVPVAPDDEPETWDPKSVLFRALGCEIACEINVANPWTPRLSLAETYGQGRVWLAGDSAHQVIPTGGYGMNTGIGDAVGLGWALAAQVHGWGGARLLQAYETERRHVGWRNREGSARHANVRADIRRDYDPVVHDDGNAGQSKRAAHGAHIMALGNLENEAWGLEWGYRYDGSPVICHESGDPPPYDWEAYTPSTWPGSRPPNIFLEDGTPLFDKFGRQFTLIAFDGTPATALVEAAETAGVPLTVLALTDRNAAHLYGHKLVLLRPDQHVAWRGDSDPATDEAERIINIVRGAS
ncbi:MAG: FAD-dependent monooxygenase [Pseudomonadota bacterium]